LSSRASSTAVMSSRGTGPEVVRSASVTRPVPGSSRATQGARWSSGTGPGAEGVLGSDLGPQVGAENRVEGVVIDGTQGGARPHNSLRPGLGQTAACAEFRMRPAIESLRSDRSRSRMRAILPCPSATTTLVIRPAGGCRGRS
jgi:hypothetical protein